MKRTLLLAALFIPVAAQAGDTSLRDLRKAIADREKTLADIAKQPLSKQPPLQQLFPATLPQSLPQPSTLLPLNAGGLPSPPPMSFLPPPSPPTPMPPSLSPEMMGLGSLPPRR